MSSIPTEYAPFIWDNVWPVDLHGQAPFGNDWGKLDRFKKAGYGAIGVTLAGDNHSIAEAVGLITDARRHIDLHADSLVLVSSIHDILRAKAEGKLAIVLQFEGMQCLEGRLEMVGVYQTLGIKQNLLAFNTANDVGGGCADPTDEGLTPFGKDVVCEMQRVGMIVDLSHVGYRTSMEALELADRPMVFSHSNIAALHPSFRNINDDQIDHCAKTGGVIGTSACSAYLGDDDTKTETIFRHIDYVVQRVGPAHAALGLDILFDTAPIDEWMRSRPEEWPVVRDPEWSGMHYAQPKQLTELVALMAANGYDKAAIDGVCSGNLMRVAKAAW
ncbi:MAG: membrane dipeptidase [Pseudomonadota bacterium]